MELGKKIRQLRFRAGFTQEQLADRLGISAQSVSKWENSVAMPDISALPLIAEVFGVSIDELFDLSAEQRLNRIENRMDTEEDLPGDVFLEYEEFLKGQLETGSDRQRATELLAYLYWHRMETYARKTSRWGREAVRMQPGKKMCQWMIDGAEGNAKWDWNMSNHIKAVEFYREVAEAAPGERLPLSYLIDNLIADNRADEAEKYIEKYAAMEGVNPAAVIGYRARLALARFDEKEGDRIIGEALAARPDDSGVLFEAAQYFAHKADYANAVGYYEKSFACDPARPRFIDALMAVTDIHEAMGDWKAAAESAGRMVDALQNEWGLTEDTELKKTMERRAKLLEKAEQA